VTLDDETRPARQRFGQPLDLALGKLHHAPTPVADEVMAVAFRGRGIVAVPVTDVHTLHESQTIQEIDGSIDAGQANLGIDSQRTAMDLGHLEVRRGVSHDLENGLSSLRQSETLRA